MSQSNAPDPTTAGFQPGSAIFDLDADAQREIIQARQRIVGAAAFRRFWNRVLTVAERDRLGGDMDAAFRSDSFPANHLVRLRAVSPERAIIEIAFQLDFMTPQTRHHLLAELGEATDQIAASPTPIWDRFSGQLHFRGEIARRVRTASAKNVVLVLDAFQDACWPLGINNPVRSVDPQQIHQTVESLNNGTDGIRFYVNGQQICWEAIDFSG